jgi:ADP-heptose:LPS heptosyltransferase
MKAIGIIRRNGLGDLLSVMPLVYLCKDRFPESQVTLFVDQRAAPLLPYIDGIDDAVVIAASKNKYTGLIKTLWSQKGKSYDLLISAKPSPMKLLNLFLYALNGKNRIAVVDEAWHAKLITDPRVYDPSERHQMVKSLRLLDPSLESVPPQFKPRLKVTPTRQFSKKTLLVSVSNNRLGSTLDADKIQRLLKNLPFHVVINCEPQDLDKAKSLATGLESEIIPTASFHDFISLIASVDACFIGDGGIMHIAAALDKPQLVLFGGTKIWEWAPLSDKAVCLGDPHNVNFIPEEQIQEKLYELWKLS